jgi:hypothetical protein
MPRVKALKNWRLTSQSISQEFYSCDKREGNESMSRELETRVRFMKLVYGILAPCALAIGLWMVISPSNFFDVLHVDFNDPLAQTLYGAVLCGVGVICFFGIFKPLQYIVIFQFVIVYKVIAVLALIPRLAAMENDPIAGWMIVVFWGCLAAVSALIYPWGKRAEVVEALKHE